MKVISQKTSRRVCDHMNKDHLDSVYKYLKFYGKIHNFKTAEMEEITNKFIKVKYDDKIFKLNFEEEISEEDIHDTLVKMLKGIDIN